MKCDICKKRIWFWRFTSSRSIGGAIAHNKCWEEELTHKSTNKSLKKIKQPTKKDV